jgi:hypothetical protein
VITIELASGAVTALVGTAVGSAWPGNILQAVALTARTATMPVAANILFKFLCFINSSKYGAAY